MTYVFLRCIFGALILTTVLYCIYFFHNVITKRLTKKGDR
jgi:hypothetical protein